MVAPAKLTKYYTTEEFMALSLDEGMRYELVRGEIQAMSQPGQRHTRLLTRLMLMMGAFLSQQNLAEVLQAGGFELRIPGEQKDTLRSPDLTVVAKAYLADVPGAFQAVPDLAVEVYSPNDRPGKLREKLEDYQQAGWNRVWVIYPKEASPRAKQMTIDLYRLQEETGLEIAQTFDHTATMLGEGFLEGFSLQVSNLFDLIRR